MITREEKRQLQRFLSGEEETFSTVLLSGLIRLYGPEVINWEGDTIQLQVKEDLELEMPRRIYDQLMGLLSVLNTDAIYKDANVFDVAVASLNRQGLVFDNRSPTVKDIAWTVAEIGLNDPEPVTRDPRQPWGRQIQKYIQAVMEDEGMKIAPAILAFVPIITPNHNTNESPAEYAGTWGIDQAEADEIDQEIEDRFRVLLQHLQSLGITVTGDEESKDALATHEGSTN